MLSMTASWSSPYPIPMRGERMGMSIMNGVENRIPEVPEKSKTEPGTTSKTQGRASKLRQARKRANGPFRCDWCGQIKPGMRRSGPRICDDCWRDHVAHKRGS